ncbi:MAG: NAD(P)-dependent oxidoreductase [Candidatus Heimdallarchaeota archaeon]|nr:NAD(P)-dependent oxidoreductase [Candidatus Heimdallarchaeota archaeon]
MVLLVTGGTGLVGSFLVEILAKDENYQGSRVIVRNQESEQSIRNYGLIPVYADLNNLDTLKTAIKDVDGVLNVASLASDTVGWNDLFRVNVEGMKNLVTACMKGNNDPYMAHVSSTGVYGHYIPKYPIDESYKFNPTSIYQKSKYLQEQVIWEAHHQEGWDNFGILRSPSVVGPRDTKTMLRIFEAIYQRKFPIFRNGVSYLTFIHPYDLSKALLLLYKEKPHAEAFNLKSFECKLKELMDYVIIKINPPKVPKKMNYHLVYALAIFSEAYTKITGHDTTLNRYRVSKFGQSRRYIDTKIRSLGFEPQKTMKQTIDEAFDWAVENGLFPPSN